jgi:hypothetical protein
VQLPSNLSAPTAQCPECHSFKTSNANELVQHVKHCTGRNAICPRCSIFKSCSAKEIEVHLKGCAVTEVGETTGNTTSADCMMQTNGVISAQHSATTGHMDVVPQPTIVQQLITSEPPVTAQNSVKIEKPVMIEQPVTAVKPVSVSHFVPPEQLPHTIRTISPPSATFQTITNESTNNPEGNAYIPCVSSIRH